MISQVVGALFNACWQGLAIVAVAGLGLRLVPRTSAATRYAAWFAVLIAVAALPAIDFGIARLATPVVITPPANAVRFDIVQTQTITYPRAVAQGATHSDAHAASHVPTTVVGYAVETEPNRLTQLLAWVATVNASAGALLSASAQAIVLVWVSLCALLLARLASSYIHLRRVKRSVVPLDDARMQGIIAGSTRPVTVGLADDLTMPCVLGFAQPVIALPAKLAAELTDADLDRIVRHEHAHVRRWDDVANAAQLIVQAVMCLNPAVHIISRNLNIEREIACDDFAVEPLAERLQYAKCLTHIAVNGFDQRRALPAPGFFFNRKQLLVRVERLLERGHNGSTRIAKSARFGVVALAFAALVVARIQVPVVAANVEALPAVRPVLPAQPAFVIRPASRISPFTAVTAHGVATPVAPAPAVRSISATILHRATTMRLHVITVLAARAPIATAMRQARINAAAAEAAAVAASAPVAIPSQPSALPAPAPRPMGGKDLGSLDSHHSGGDFLDALASAGYPPLSVDDLIRLKNVGVSADLINAAVRYNGSRPSVESLLRMAEVGVDADFLNALSSSGRARMSLDDVVRIKAIGVDPSYIHEMDSAFGARQSIDALIRMRALGVDGEYVRSFVALGYNHLTPEDYTRLRAVGVDAAYVRMLRSKGIGGSKGISVDDLVRMKSVGVE